MFRHSFLRRKKSKSGANSYFFLLAIIPSPRPPLPFSLPSFLEHSKNRVWRFAAFLFAAHLYIDIDRKRKQHAKYRHTSLFFSFLFSFSHLSPFSFSLFPSSSSSSCFFFFKQTQFDSGSNRLSRRNTPLSRVSIDKNHESWERGELESGRTAFFVSCHSCISNHCLDCHLVKILAQLSIDRGEDGDYEEDYFSRMEDRRWAMQRFKIFLIVSRLFWIIDSIWNIFPKFRKRNLELQHNNIIIIISRTFQK